MVPMRCVCACVSVKQRCCITRRQFHSPSPQRVLLHFWIFRQTKAHPQLKITYSTCLFFLPSLATFYTLYLLSSSLSPSSSFSYHYSHCEHFILSSLSQCLYLLLLRWYTYSQFRCWPNYVSCLSLIHLTVFLKKKLLLLKTKRTKELFFFLLTWRNNNSVKIYKWKKSVISDHVFFKSKVFHSKKGDKWVCIRSKPDKEQQCCRYLIESYFLKFSTKGSVYLLSK